LFPPTAVKGPKDVSKYNIGDGATSVQGNRPDNSLIED